MQASGLTGLEDGQKVSFDTEPDKSRQGTKGGEPDGPLTGGGEERSAARHEDIEFCSQAVYSAMRNQRQTSVQTRNGFERRSSPSLPPDPWPQMKPNLITERQEFIL